MWELQLWDKWFAIDSMIKRWAVSGQEGTKPPTNKRNWYEWDGMRGGLINRIEIQYYQWCIIFYVFSLLALIYQKH